MYLFFRRFPKANNQKVSCLRPTLHGSTFRRNAYGPVFQFLSVRFSVCSKYQTSEEKGGGDAEAETLRAILLGLSGDTSASLYPTKSPCHIARNLQPTVCTFHFPRRSTPETNHSLPDGADRYVTATQISPRDSLSLRPLASTTRGSFTKHEQTSYRMYHIHT